MNDVLLLIICGLFAGFVGGMFGVGGGIVIVSVLVFFMGFTQQQAQGTSTATLLFPIGALAALNYYKSGNINMKFAIIIAITFVLGAYFGSKVAIRLDQKTLKRIFSLFMIGVAFKMFWETYKN